MLFGVEPAARPYSPSRGLLFLAVPAGTDARSILLSLRRVMERASSANRAVTQGRMGLRYLAFASRMEAPTSSLGFGGEVTDLITSEQPYTWVAEAASVGIRIP